MSYVKIDFDDEIRTLIVLASLPNSWKAMWMAVSNSTGKEKLKYNDIRDLILVEEICRRDVGETSGFGSGLNLETRGRIMTEIQIGADQNPKILIKIEVNLDQANKYNAGTVRKQVTLGGNAKFLRRRMKMILLML